MPSNPKEIVDGTVEEEKALDVSQRLKPAQLAFPLSCGLVGDFCAIIGILLCEVIDGGAGDPVSRLVTTQLVGD